LLAKTVASSYQGEVEFVEESWATSTLAQRYGVKYYPAIFVNDVLVARPGDFRNKDGRYSPWIGNAPSHDRFRADLKRMLDLARAGKMDVVRKESQAGAAPDVAELARIPPLRLQTLAGDAIDLAKPTGKLRVVEFWATWCPPCRSTLAWLGELQGRYPGRLDVLGIAVESEEPAVRALADSLKLGFPIAMTTPETSAGFGDVLSVPTLFVFDADGKTVAVFYGAPEDLHASVQSTIERALR
jgi:thiol-disulfide isomerase/thioredoxin